MIAKDKKYNDLQNEIASVGFAIPGTIHETYLKCGKQNCRCMSGDKNDQHGPYYFWYRKINGQFSRLSITKEDLRYYKNGIANRRKLEKLINEMLNVGAQLATQFKRASKIKKTASPTQKNRVHGD